MKKLMYAFAGNAKNIAGSLIEQAGKVNKNKPAFLIIVSSLLFTAGCKKMTITDPPLPYETAGLIIKSDAEASNTLLNYEGMDKQTMWELQQARAATARYQNINNAYADGYVDINVVVFNMGHHFMKSSLVDARFEIRRPEILVYNKLEDQSFQLVAVEYAIPIDLSPVNAPEGFTGNSDVWDRNTGFGLWLLHAWVWHYNPAGVFNATNPLVHSH